MKLLDRLRLIIAQGESVASDEIGAVVPAWRNFVPKWSSYSRTGKFLAVLIPLALIAVFYGIGINALEFAAARVFRGGGGNHPVATQADIKDLQGQIDILRTDLSGKPTRSDIVAVKSAVAASTPTMLEFNQMQDDVHQLQTEFEAMKKPAPIATGSISPKKKKPVAAKSSPSLTDPSSWKIIP